MASSSNTNTIKLKLNVIDIAFGILHIPKEEIERCIIQHLPPDEQIKYNNDKDDEEIKQLIEQHLSPFEQLLYNEEKRVSIVLVDKDIGDMYELKLTDDGILGGWNKVVMEKNLMTRDHLILEYVNDALYMKIIRKYEQDLTTTNCLVRRRIQKTMTFTDAFQMLDQLSLPRVYIISHIVPYMYISEYMKLKNGESVTILLDISEDAYTYELKLSFQGLHDGWSNIVMKKNLTAGDHLELDYDCNGSKLFMKISRQNQL